VGGLSRPLLFALAALCATSVGVVGQAERFDRGRMWTFEAPPTEWLAEEYGLEADEAWLQRARLGSVRLPGCSGSFVSPDGLILTNHHCVRDALPSAALDGEDLLTDGFVARDRENERELPGFVVEQFVWSEDVTARLDEAVGDDEGEKREEKLDEERAEIEEEALERFGPRFGGEDALSVEFVEIWAGARTSLQVWRRLEDIRLVMAPETSIGFFGGDEDNFEYPRWNLDIAFLRAWDGNDPYASNTWFEMSEFGVGEGDAVFVVGNPGATSRWSTLDQLALRREMTEPAVLEFVRTRADAMASFTSASPESARTENVSNDLFSARNSEKSLAGMLAGLEDPEMGARLEARHGALLEAAGADSTASARLEQALSRIADVQEQKRTLEREHRAFLGLTATGLASPTLHRAFITWQILRLRGQGAPVSFTADLMAALDSVRSVPLDLDEELVATRLEEFAEAFGGEERWLVSILRGRSAEGAAARIMAETLFADSAATSEAMALGRIDGNDPALRLVNLYVPTFRSFQEAWFGLERQEEAAVREMFAVVLDVLDGEAVPDANGSPRLSDGRVESYRAADGTMPPVTTRLGGLFERSEELAGDDGSPWSLPERWWTSRAELDPDVPLNFVVGADIAGGSSGSPVLTGGLELVGVVFDSPAESLPSDYLFDPAVHRAIAVDARAILHTLLVVYDMDTLVAELRGGAIAVRQPT
jgi:hypothetical protein